MLAGNLGWFLMEIWGPVVLLLCMCSSAAPLSTSGPLRFSTVFPDWSISNFLSLPTANKLLGGFYVLHYINRAIIEPLRSPPRTPMSIIIPLTAGSFQVTNGFLLGTWLAGRSPAYILGSTVATASAVKQSSGFFSFFSSNSASTAAGAAARSAAASTLGAISPSILIARPGLVPDAALHSMAFWTFLSLALLGLASNAYHDELLASLRREPKQSSIVKAAVNGNTPAESTRSSRKAAKEQLQIGENGASVEKQEDEAIEVTLGSSKYKIPQGGLFEYIDHAHYVSEWFEWLCFAIASLVVILPALVPAPTAAAAVKGAVGNNLGLFYYISRLFQTISVLFRIPPSLFFVTVTIVTLPRALKGHQWYLKTFGDKYPKNRKAIVPGIL